MLIQAMGLLFTASTLALAVALQGNALLTFDLGALSTAALVPAVIGMAIGQRIRQSLPERRFRRVFFIALLVLGAYIIATALRGSLLAPLRAKRIAVLGIIDGAGCNRSCVCQFSDCNAAVALRRSVRLLSATASHSE